MSCCAPGTEAAIELAGGPGDLPPSEELMLASRSLGDGCRQIDLSVPGVHCGACITTLEGALAGQPDIVRARVNLSTRRLSVVFREAGEGGPVDPRIMLAPLSSTGYAIHLSTPGEEEVDRELQGLIRAVAVSGFAAANIMLLSVSVWSGADHATRDLFHWISAMIAAPALIYAGRFFYLSAWNALKHGRTNMDVPIALAVTLSYGMSVYETIHHGAHAWFDASVTLLFFLLIGRTLDHLMRGRARSAISGLARLMPRGAMVELQDGQREYRPTGDLKAGDRILIAAGERIPVDGVVETGSSDLDCSLVNGESAPLAVAAGTAVQGGTLNLTGALTITATASARESFLADVIALMEAAEGGRARYRRIADRAARYYSPAVHLLALLSFIGWMLVEGDMQHAMLIAVSVLIITCPCALGLAVPVVQVVAAGRLFEGGVMVKDGSAMERLAEIDTVLFDKTGTLTIGKPRLLNGGDVSSDLLSRAASLAAGSRHPLSIALHAAAGHPAGYSGTLREIPGGGMEAAIGSDLWRLGSRAFAGGAGGVDDRSGGQAFSEVVLSRNGTIEAIFLFEDQLRPGAAKAVEALSADGFDLAIVSGDRTPVVEGLAQRLGIARWFAGLSPRGKTQTIEDARAHGHRVLMVGDGINDAPALRAAHVSMAPATAADVGRQAADFVFMHADLGAVSHAIAVSRRAGRLIRQNFALAIGYNVIAVPVAILGHATPLVAAVAMSTSSVVVIVNALRLKGLGRRRAKGQEAGAQQGFAVGRERAA